MEEDPRLTPTPWWAPGYRSFKPRGRAAALAGRVGAVLLLLIIAVSLISFVTGL